MNNITTIFKDRRIKESEKRATYNKYIFNSHLVMFIIIVFGAVMINYSKWIKTAENLELYSVLVVSVLLLSYLIVFSKAKTYIKEADSVFLLPLENHYRKIFYDTALRATIVHSILAVLFYFATKPITDLIGNFQPINILILLFVIYIVNIVKLKDAVYGIPNILNYILQYIMVVLALMQTILYSNYISYAYIGFLILSLAIFFSKNKSYSNINWYGATDYDKQREESYLKFINMFVDVPMESIKVSRRKYFDILLPKLNKNNFVTENSFNYYYYRIFLRQENTVFLALRLMLIAVLFMYSFKNSYVSSVILVSYAYLTIIQLVPLYKKINNSVWAHILPVKEEIKVNSFKKLLTIVMLVTTIILLIFAVILTEFSIQNIVIIFVGLVIANLISKIFINKIK